MAVTSSPVFLLQRQPYIPIMLRDDDTTRNKRAEDDTMEESIPKCVNTSSSGVPLSYGTI